MNPDQAPDEAAVSAILGERFAWYEAICDAGDDFEQEWKFYGKKYGWKLKVHDYVKTLFELTVGDGVFRIGLAVREGELAALRADPAVLECLGELLSAEKANEGWGIRLIVDTETRFQQALLLVQTVGVLRQASD